MSSPELPAAFFAASIAACASPPARAAAYSDAAHSACGARACVSAWLRLTECERGVACTFALFLQRCSVSNLWTPGSAWCVRARRVQSTVSTLRYLHGIGIGIGRVHSPGMCSVD